MQKKCIKINTHSECDYIKECVKSAPTKEATLSLSLTLKTNSPLDQTTLLSPTLNRMLLCVSAPTTYAIPM